MDEQVIMSGFGGQGVMLIGKLLAYIGMAAGKEVAYMPSYGAEVRGGTANCHVIISNDAIASPVVTKCDSLIAMNKASVNRFAKQIKSGGLLVYNSSLIEPQAVDELDGDFEMLAVSADDIALKIGTIRVANMVALGAYLRKRKLFSIENAIESLPSVLAIRHHNLLDINIQALKGEKVTV
ncbi:MAG: 2-oxoacid:acceptor oxidoreductase family protein [Phycisphaerae bacterium]|nr:2-oxoacid:acceptor oxidoreductase family protein [Phycisphaerae bacterium]